MQQPRCPRRPAHPHPPRHRLPSLLAAVAAVAGLAALGGLGSGRARAAGLDPAPAGVVPRRAPASAPTDVTPRRAPASAPASGAPRRAPAAAPAGVVPRRASASAPAGGAPRRASAAALRGAAATGPLQDGVVKLFVTSSAPSYIQPWQMKNQESQTGSGAIIAGHRILTNAHVVSDQVFIQVLRGGQTKKYTATVEFVAHDCDLALLRVEDDRFFEGATALPLGELPALRDQVAAYGFPKGGQKLSITSGVISRMEIRPYAHSHRRLLTLQLDAAINPGNSGGPVLKGRDIVGVAFQVGEGQNLGYAVPVPVVRRFLADVRDGRYDGIPDLGIEWQATESEAMRAALGLRGAASGVLVTGVRYRHSAYGVLRAGDVLLEIAGRPVAADGTIAFTRDDRIAFPYALLGAQIGDRLALKVLRDRRRLKLAVRLTGARPLVPRSRYDVKPSYYLFAGMIFMPLTEDYMDLWQDWRRVPANYRYYYGYGRPGPDRTEVVVLSQILPHEVTLGYHGSADLVVRRVNGRPIRALRDLVPAFAHPAGRFHVIETEGGKRIVLDAALARVAHREILTRYGIPRDRSADLR